MHQPGQAPLLGIPWEGCDCEQLETQDFAKCLRSSGRSLNPMLTTASFNLLHLAACHDRHGAETTNALPGLPVPVFASVLRKLAYELLNRDRAVRRRRHQRSTHDRLEVCYGFRTGIVVGTLAIDCFHQDFSDTAAFVRRRPEEVPVDDTADRVDVGFGG